MLAIRSLLAVLSLGVLLSAGLTIVAKYLRPERPALIYIFKPLATILILVTAWLPGTWLTDRYAGAICLGLIFSLAGDIWLMLPGDRFLPGLASFLLGLLCYVFAFQGGAQAGGFAWMLLPVALIGAMVLCYVWPGLHRGLKPPVSLYVGVFVVMVSLAAARALALPSTGTLCAAIGAGLFLVSDSILAIDRFRKPFSLAQAAVLGSYFAGQWLIALSVGLLAQQVA